MESNNAANLSGWARSWRRAAGVGVRSEGGEALRTTAAGGVLIATPPNSPKTHQVVPRKCPMDPTGGPLGSLMISGAANDKSVAICHPNREAGLMGLALDHRVGFH